MECAEFFGQVGAEFADPDPNYRYWIGSKLKSCIRIGPLVCSRKLKIVRKKLKKTVYIRTWRLVCKVLICFLLSILVLFRIFVSYCLYSYSSGYSFLTVYTRTLQDICFLSNFSLSVSDWVLDKIRIPVSKMLGTDLDPSYNNLDPKTCFCHVVPVYCIVTILIMFWNGTKPVQ